MMTRRREIKIIIVVVTATVGMYRAIMSASGSSFLTDFQVTKDDTSIFKQGSSAIDRDGDLERDNATSIRGEISSQGTWHGKKDSLNTSSLVGTVNNFEPGNGSSNDFQTVFDSARQQKPGNLSSALDDGKETFDGGEEKDKRTTASGQNWLLHHPSLSISSHRSPMSPPDQPSRSTKRWNGQHLKKALYDHSFNTSQLNTTLVERMPKPYGDDVSMYNRNAWKKLQHLFQTSTTTTLCSMGGSVTAGGHLYSLESRMNRWDLAFADMVHYSFPATHLHVENRGHGARGTFHSSQLMQSFVPPETDLIIWEFAINDSEKQGCQRTTNALILFLNQVQKVAKPTLSGNAPPPLVILAYFWDVSSFKMGKTEAWYAQENGTIPNSIYKCHRHLAASYDFVVGSVNLASYMDHLEWKDGQALHDQFLADPTHANHLGHWLMGYLLWDLITDGERRERGSETNTTTDVAPTVTKPSSLYSPCQGDMNNTSSSQERVIDLLLYQSSKASWSAEEPHNIDLRPDMMEPIMLFRDENLTTEVDKERRNLTIMNLAKASPGRVDRKYSVLLPCCTTGERLAFSLGNQGTDAASSTMAIATTAGMLISGLQVTPEGMKAPRLSLLLDFHIDLWNGPDLLRMNVTYSNKNHDPVASDNIKAEWMLYDGRKCKLESWPWLVFSVPVWVSRIDFCNKVANCRRPARSEEGTRSMMHLVVY